MILLLCGDDRDARNQVVNAMGSWMDARQVRTHFFGLPTEEEAERPDFWRYWRVLPRDGQTAVFVGAWGSKPIVRRTLDEIDDEEFEARCVQVRRFEHDLVADGAVLLKFWLHLPAKLLAKRLRKFKKDKEAGWRIDALDWRMLGKYDKAMRYAERLIGETSTAQAPWLIVETTDERHRDLTIATAIHAALTMRLAQPPSRRRSRPAMPARPPSEPSVLDPVDLSKQLDEREYERRLERWQVRLARATRRAREDGLTSVLVFEGWDAAGKGGVIRRLAAGMDVQDYEVVPIGAPTEDEARHHYLWRFWQRLPRAGKVLVFDRSWYGRVLVERVESLARADEWQRAYDEINDFEEQLLDHGILLLKYWLHIDAEEQARRFRERERTDFKKYKITAEDYRNRARREDYERAVTDMVARTSLDRARWRLVPATDKKWARVEVLKSFVKALEERL
jgi:polyphosphate:AMP phosphotransferase